MAAIFSFTCSCCGKLHEGSPSFSSPEPFGVANLAKEKNATVQMTPDTCVVGDAHFIRVCLEIPIVGVSEPFIWGVWVSLSDASFRRYIETFENPEESDEYFGWFCNRLPFYPETLHLKTLVHPRLNGVRPFVELEATDHPLSVDFHSGITVARAQEIAEHAMHRG